MPRPCSQRLFVVSRRREENYFYYASSVLTTLVRCFKAERRELFYHASSVFQGGEMPRPC